MDLNDKIKLILAGKNLSPSLFADEIGIQRSSMSHILAGRNKPSLDIVQKIVKRFPELGTNWILDDEDVPLTTDHADSERPLQYPSMRGTKTNMAQSALPGSKKETTDHGKSESPTHQAEPNQGSPILQSNKSQIHQTHQAGQPNQTEAVNLAPIITASAPSAKKVDRVIIFYSDGTFEDFKKG